MNHLPNTWLEGCIVLKMEVYTVGNMWNEGWVLSGWRVVLLKPLRTLVSGGSRISPLRSENLDSNLSPLPRK